jgi:hypothetical protein
MKATVRLKDGRTVTVEGESEEAIFAAVAEYEASLSEEAPQVEQVPKTVEQQSGPSMQDRAMDVGRRVGASVLGTAKMVAPRINPAFRDPRQVAGMGDAGAAMVSAMGTEPVAGLAGLGYVASHAGNEDALERGADVVNRIRSTAYQPKTELGQQYLQNVGTALGPVAEGFQYVNELSGDSAERAARALGADDRLAAAAGSIGYTAPTAALTMLGMPKARTANTPGFLYDAGGLPARPAVAPRIEPKVGPAQSSDEIAAATKQLIKDAQRRKGHKAVAEAVDPDPEIVAAANRLDIELTPGATSRNPVYQDLEQSLKARPNSGILAKEQRAIQLIQERADDLVRDLGGSTDRTFFAGNLRAKLDSSISELTAKAGVLYRRVEGRVPKSTEVNASNIRAYLAQQTDELGGNTSLFKPVERDLANLLKGDKVTYAALDRVRKDIGRGYSRTGPYADIDSEILNKVYAVLAKDQMAVAAQFGADDMLRTANQLANQYKTLQKNAERLFGRELMGTGREKVQQAANGLIRGDTKAFRQLLRYTPESMRQDAAVAVLNDIFVSGTRQGSGVQSGFATSFRALVRNKGALDELMALLPEHARQRFMDIGRVSDGVYRAARFSNSSTAKTLLAQAENPSGIAKIYGAKGQIAAAEAVSSAVGLPGVGSAGAIITEVLKTSKTAGQKADALISSGAMQEAIKHAAAGNVTRANSVISRSPQFQAWIATQPAEVTAQIATLGFIGWFTSQDEE